MITGDNCTLEINVMEEYLNNLSYNVWIKDEHHKYIFVNKKYCQSLGLKRNEIICKTDFDIYSFYDAVEYLRDEMEIIRKRKGISKAIKVSNNNIIKYYNSYRSVLYNEGKKKDWVFGIEKEIPLKKNIDESVVHNIYNFPNNNEKNNIYYLRMVKITKDIMKKLKTDGISLMLYDKYKSELRMYLDLSYSPYFKSKYIVKLNRNQQKALESSKKGCISFCSADYDICQWIKTYKITYNEELIAILNLHYHKKASIQEDIVDDFINYICSKYAILIKNMFLSNSLNTELSKRKESDKLLEKFLETSADLCAVIMISDDGHAYFEKITWKWAEILGYTKENLINIPAINIVHPDDKSYVKDMFKNRKKIINKRGLLIRLKCANNQYRNIEWNWTYYEENDKIIATGKDVTQNQYLYIEKKKLIEKVHLEELKTEFFSNMSHEFNTPLNIILSTVQLTNKQLENKSLSFDKAVEYLNGIRQNSYRLLRLVNNLIDTAKIQRECMELSLVNGNIVSTVENVVDSVIEYIKPNTRNIIFDTSEEEIIIAYDAEKIERVIFNLLSNSLKYTDKDGTIIVNINSTNEYIVISVYDNGSGIPKEMIEFLFDKFTQKDYLLTRNHEGSGIGLFLVKSIIKLHNGKVELNKNLSQGTEIKIYIPKITISEKDKSIYYGRSIDAQIEMCNIELSDLGF